MTRSCILATVVAMASVACASTPPAKPTTDPAQARLNQAAAAIQTSLRQLAEAEQYERMKVAPGTPDHRLPIES